MNTPTPKLAFCALALLRAFRGDLPIPGRRNVPAVNRTRADLRRYLAARGLDFSDYLIKKALARLSALHLIYRCGRQTFMTPHGRNWRGLRGSEGFSKRVCGAVNALRALRPTAPAPYQPGEDLIVTVETPQDGLQDLRGTVAYSRCEGRVLGLYRAHEGETERSRYGMSEYAGIHLHADLTTATVQSAPNWQGKVVAIRRATTSHAQDKAALTELATKAQDNGWERANVRIAFRRALRGIHRARQGLQHMAKTQAHYAGRPVEDLQDDVSKALRAFPARYAPTPSPVLSDNLALALRELPGESLDWAGDLAERETTHDTARGLIRAFLYLRKAGLAGAC